VSKQKLDNAMDAFDADCDFPWQDGAFNHLERYIVSVDQSLTLAHDLQTKALRDAIAVATHPVALGELQYELARLEGEDEVSNQRLVWGGLLVSIYAMFEYGLEQIFEHWRLVTNGPAFKTKGGEDIVSAAVRHSTDCMELRLFETTSERDCLNQLRTLRKSFVHKGGKITAIPPNLWTIIQSRKNLGFPLEIVDERWCANVFASQYYLDGTYQVMRRFSRAVSAKI
jgi:hypothetical protein